MVQLVKLVTLAIVCTNSWLKADLEYDARRTLR